nr:glycoside hydrolase [Clostridia bacterium]
MDIKNVPSEYRPIPFWSWNEKLEVNETREQINKMHDAGIGGFFMHARGGLQTEYMGGEWFDNVEASASEAEKLDMHAWAYDENGWPSGFGAGVVNGRGIEYQQKYLRIKEGEEAHERLIVNKDGWCFYYDVNPYYVDTLDGDVTEVFIEEIYQKYYDRFAGRIDGFFTDEPQISRNGIPWSFIMPREYKAAYGEDLLERLVELFQNVGDYKRTRMQFWKLVTELFSKNFMKKIYDWCHEHNFKLTGHLVLEESLYSQLVSNGACMPHFEYFDIPGMDWLGRHNNYSLTPYEVGSAARQTGKKQVLSETFACCGHNVGHDELKWILEYQMVRGITLLCQHLEGYSNRGLRKRDYPPAMYIQQPWWNDYKMFNDAMSRTGMLLTGGDDKVDVLVLHPQTTAWTLYDDKNHQPLHDCNARFLKLLKTLEEKHVNFHLGDEILLERHGKVEDDKFIIGEKSYSKVII